MTKPPANHEKLQQEIAGSVHLALVQAGDIREVEEKLKAIAARAAQVVPAPPEITSTSGDVM